MNPDDLPPLPWYAVRVDGPRGRVSYVDTRPGAVIPFWITVVEYEDGTDYFDNGKGYFFGEERAQQLPTLAVTAPPWPVAAASGTPWVFLAILAGLAALVFWPGSRRRMEW